MIKTKAKLSWSIVASFEWQFQVNWSHIFIFSFGQLDADFALQLVPNPESVGVRYREPKDQVQWLQEPLPLLGAAKVDLQRGSDPQNSQQLKSPEELDWTDPAGFVQDNSCSRHPVLIIVLFDKICH